MESSPSKEANKSEGPGDNRPPKDKVVILIISPPFIYTLQGHGKSSGSRSANNPDKKKSKDVDCDPHKSSSKSGGLLDLAKDSVPSGSKDSADKLLAALLKANKATDEKLAIMADAVTKLSEQQRMVPPADEGDKFCGDFPSL